MAQNAHQGKIRMWHPTLGIVFGNIPLPSQPSPPRSLSTISTSIAEHDAFMKPNKIHNCLFNSSLQLSSSNSEYNSSPSQNGTDSDNYSWDPPSASQDSNLESLARQNTMEADQEFQEEEVKAELNTPLAFQIPQEVLQKAKDAIPGTKDSFWSYKMYLGPESQEVKVHYCRSKHTTERVAKYFLNETVIGFDIEWKPEATKNSGIKNNVALIQLASETRIALFHIAAFPKDTVSDLVAPTMQTIMENAGITKVGVAIKADCTRLRNYLNIDPRGILELSHLYKLVKYSSSGNEGKINKRLVSLTTQAEEYLELPIFKGEVRGSDWTQSLSIDQIKYAASDAYANFMLHDALECKRKQLRPVPPRPHHAELNLPIRLASGAVITTTDEVADDFEPKKTSVAASLCIPVSIHEAAAENIQIEDETEQSFIGSTLSSKAKAKSADSSTHIASQPKPQFLIKAESWATAHRASNPPIAPAGNSPPTAAFSALRVYALWHDNPLLSLSEIASLLRDPPLRKSTVAAYILDSIRLEKLPFEKERLIKVLQVIPDSRRMWRYRGLWKLI